jgi:hypothetical protein
MPAAKEAKAMGELQLRDALEAAFGDSRFDTSRVAHAAETVERLVAAIEALVPHPTMPLRLLARPLQPQTHRTHPKRVWRGSTSIDG